MKTIQRASTDCILNAKQSFPVVYVNGPRQAGKTTLVNTLLAEKFPAKFISFDDLLERVAAKHNPLTYLNDIGTPVTTDEVQLVPELFRRLKQLVDKKRQQALATNQHANGAYLLTGSTNLLAIPELANAMVGRMASFTLLLFSMNVFYMSG